MEGSPKDDKKSAPKDERKDPPRDERPPREEGYRDTDRYRRDRREDWGRDDYRRPEPRGQPMDMGAFFMPQRIGMMALLGVILLLIGAMLATSSIITELDDDPEDAHDQGVESKETYQNSLYISELGMLLIALPLFGGALLNDRIDEKMRIGMLIGGSIVVFGLFSAIANGVFLMGA